jgi:hypothetical protein
MAPRTHHKWTLSENPGSLELVPEDRTLTAAPFQMGRSREVLMIPAPATEGAWDEGRFPCADCGKPARWTVIEQSDTPNAHGWQWCGWCEVG